MFPRVCDCHVRGIPINTFCNFTFTKISCCRIHIWYTYNAAQYCWRFSCSLGTKIGAHLLDPKMYFYEGFYEFLESSICTVTSQALEVLQQTISIPALKYCMKFFFGFNVCISLIKRSLSSTNMLAFGELKHCWLPQWYTLTEFYEKLLSIN